MPASARVALLTSGAHAHLDTDLPLLVGALAEREIPASAVDWHDDQRDWSAFELVVVRSTWDYTDQVPTFLGALDRIAAATAVANPLPVLRANLDKRYLLRLAEAGVPVVPTTVVEPGAAASVPAGACVVKPVVSAGARDTERFEPGDRSGARAHVAAIHASGRAALVQPYVSGVDEHGETGLVHLDGRFSHAFRKGPILRPGTGFVEGLYREEEITARQPSAAERAAAEVVLDAVGSVAPGFTREDLLYARVDLVPGPDGPLLMELELVEPSLFLETDAGAARRAAGAIERRLARGSSHPAVG